MMAASFILLGLTALMGLPVLTYFYAKHLGRNAKKWFLIGLLLPGIATIILSLLPEVKNKNN